MTGPPVGPVVVLVNPSSRGGRSVAAGKQAVETLRHIGIQAAVVSGATPAEATERVRRAIDEGARLVAASGGDGLMHLALQAVADRSPEAEPVTLGVIPVGTGNDLARLLGMPIGDPEAAAAVLAAGFTRPLDLIRVEGSTPVWVATVLACAFDALVARQAASWRRPHGPLAYRLGVLAELARFRPLPFRLTLDGAEVLERTAMVLAVGNGPSYGSGMRICPAADPADGLLDLTVVTAISRLKLLRVFSTVYTGAHVRLPQVHTFRAARVNLHGPDLVVYGDGEPVGSLPLTVTAQPAAVRVAALP